MHFLLSLQHICLRYYLSFKYFSWTAFFRNLNIVSNTGCPLCIAVFGKHHPLGVQLCWCVFVPPALHFSPGYSAQPVGLGRCCRHHPTFLWALVLCNTHTSVPLAFVSFRTYNIYISTRTLRKIILIHKRFDELTNHHFAFCSSNRRSWSTYRRSLCLCTHICVQRWTSGKIGKDWFTQTVIFSQYK